MPIEQLYYLGSRLEPVHAWHLDVHEDQFIHLVAAFFKEPLFHHVYCQLPAHCLICLEMVEKFQKLLHHVNVIRCVINYQNIVFTGARII